MAAETQQSAISAAFPAPPPFYRSFTTENLELLQRYADPSSQLSLETLHSSRPSIDDPTSLPAELHHLISPSPPPDGKYRSFGIAYDINSPPPTSPSIPTRENLLNLTDRLMQLFRRYIQIMATNPAGELWVPQWEEIRKTFEECHGIINEYRPHEARESLILRYEDQIRQVREETERAKASVERAKQVVDDMGRGGGDGGVTLAAADMVMENNKERHKLTSEKERKKAKDKLVWDVIDKEVGIA